MSAELPTLHVHARTCDGDALDAIVTIAGIAGARATLDPGWHDVRAEIGGRAEEQSVFIAEGEHKSVSLVIASAPRPMPLAVPVLVGTSVAALGAAGVLWAVSLSTSTRLVAMYPAALNGPLVEDATQRDFAV